MTNQHETVARPPYSEYFVGNVWTLPTDLQIAAPAADAIVQRMAGLGWTEEEIGGFKLAVQEVINNAILHGNLGLVRERQTEEDWDEILNQATTSAENLAKKVVITQDITKDYARISVIDEGTGIEVEKLLNKPAQEFSAEIQAILDKPARDRTGEEVMQLLEHIELHDRGMILIKAGTDEITSNKERKEVTVTRIRANHSPKGQKKS
jgi:histidine kinase-like protein